MLYLRFIKNLGKGGKEMSRAKAIITDLEKVVENITDFIQFDDRSEFEIIDFKGQSYIIEKINNDKTCSLFENLIVDYDAEKIFKLSDAKGIYFIPIDGKKGLLGYGDSWCDCVFFDENDFCFVEFKLNVTSENKINKNRFKGLNQLINTVEKFDEWLDEFYHNLDLKAYLCTPSFYKTVGETAEWENAKVEFGDDYEIEFFETNEKIWKPKP